MFSTSFSVSLFKLELVTSLCSLHISSSTFEFHLTEPELVLQASKAEPVVAPLPGKVRQAVLSTLEHLEAIVRTQHRIQKNMKRQFVLK